MNLDPINTALQYQHKLNVVYCKFNKYCNSINWENPELFPAFENSFNIVNITGNGISDVLVNYLSGFIREYSHVCRRVYDIHTGNIQIKEVVDVIFVTDGGEYVIQLISK